MKFGKQIPQSQPAAETLAALQAELRKIKTARDADHAELLRIDLPGGVFQTDDSKLANEARLLLNGAVATLLPPPGPDVADRIAALKHKVKVADRALDDGGRLIMRLQSEAAHERMRLHANDVRDCMEAIADAVLALEDALRRRDTLLKKLKPTHLDLIPGAGWAFLGRVCRTESQAYRFLQAASAAGWISEEKLQAAIRESRKAMG